MWSVRSNLVDPIPLSHVGEHHYEEGIQPKQLLSSKIIHAAMPVSDVFASDPQAYTVFQNVSQEREARVALADFFARKLVEMHSQLSWHQNGVRVVIEPLLNQVITNGNKKSSSCAKRRAQIHKLQSKKINEFPPYVLERTDVWCCGSEVHVMMRMLIYRDTTTTASMEDSSMWIDDEKKTGDGMDTTANTTNEIFLEAIAEQSSSRILNGVFDIRNKDLILQLMQHIACVTLQERLRSQLTSVHNAVAFICNQSIIARKSGASELPMPSPPAVPFMAPEGSPMSQQVKVDMGILSQYVPTSNLSSITKDTSSNNITLSGLIVPAGVTLIVGGGYHGKSTLLRAIASGVYDKIPGDGREYCVAIREAVSVRAEDGRFVNNCNVSAFISNLPTPKGSESSKPLDTQHFSSKNCSGSTSQASNVVEAIEMGAKCLLVDEDVSAANFMARDGRMRALVMDESITPLLYRVNGLHTAHGISCIVVVGGVGDWLDVPDNVILLNRYEAFDATKKAQSVSRQFSHGHVQYAGRGTTHRLQWEKSGSPIPRRPMDSFSKLYGKNDTISLLDSGHAIAIHGNDEDDNDSTMIMEDNNDAMMLAEDDEDRGNIDASRLEQLLSRQQLYGCGICVSWILKTAIQHPKLDIHGLLKKLEETLDKNGMIEILLQQQQEQQKTTSSSSSSSLNHLLESVGFAHRPRMFEIGQALTRLRGIQFEELPVEEDPAEIAARKAAEEKKRKLREIWEARRKK